jgi:hypothetical protein
MFEGRHQKQGPAGLLRLLRRKDNHQYFTGSGWTPHIEQARCFNDSIEAAKVCVAWSLTDVELVLRFHHRSSELFPQGKDGIPQKDGRPKDPG